jgi:hypothetical protein
MDELFVKLKEKIEILRNNSDKLIVSKDKLLETMKISNVNISNILANFDILNNDIECMIEYIDNMNINIENEILTDCSDKTRKLMENRKHTRKVLEPFLPYLLLMNMLA